MAPRGTAHGTGSGRSSNRFSSTRSVRVRYPQRVNGCVALRWGRLPFLVRAAIVLLVALVVASCGDGEAKLAPRVTGGVLDARAWDFDDGGALALAGEWTACVERRGDALPPVGETFPCADTLEIPWQDAHRRTRGGLDVDASRWVTLGVRIELPPTSAGAVIEVSDFLAESFVLTCRDDGGGFDELRAGMDPAAPETYREALWPLGSVGLAKSGYCSLIVPRGVLAQTTMLAAPRLVASKRASADFARDMSIEVTNAVAMFTFAAFAGLMAALNRRDSVARWSLVWGALMFVRIFVVNRGLFWSADSLVQWRAILNFRTEFVDLWLLAIALGRYGEEMSLRRLPLRPVVFGALLVLAAIAAFGPYALTRRVTPLGEVLLLWVLVATTVALASRRNEAAARLALAGIGFALLGAVGSVLSFTLYQRQSRFFELVGSIEPLFQMAVLSVRAADARARIARFATAMQRFVPREFLHALGHEDVTTAKLGDARAGAMTVLFADIRNFTMMSERLSPEATFATLNRCLSKIAPVIRAHGGFVDKYIGDAVMALFPGDPSQAVRAAAAMQVELARDKSLQIGDVRLDIGVGVHHGFVMLGTIGEEERFEATVISDTVNLTSRLESLTKKFGCGVLLTGEVAQELDAELREQVRPLGSFVVKGKVQPVQIFELFASDADAIRVAKISSRERVNEMLTLHAEGRHEAALAVAEELHARCREDGPVRWWLARLEQERVGDGKPSSRGIVLLDEK
jgi:class 3 adenylate cyclase